MSLDPVTVGIASGRLHSILDEQQATLVRTAFSTIVRESEDLACGVFDRGGRMLGQSHSGTPGHINAMATGARHIVEAFPPGTLEPGDVLVTNDPWMTAGQINDLTVATPVFRGERMIGLFASTCHAPKSADTRPRNVSSSRSLVSSRSRNTLWRKPSST